MHGSKINGCSPALSSFIHTLTALTYGLRIILWSTRYVGFGGLSCQYHYYKSGHLSRFQRAICPGFGTGTRPPGQKRWRLLSRVVEPGQNVPRAKKYLRPVGLEPKTYCLAHGLLANSPK